MIDLLIAGLAEILGVAMEALVDLIMPIFGFDFTLFNTSFPFAATAYTIFQSIALGIVLVLAASQLIPFFFGAKQSKTTPIRTGLFVILAIFGIYYGNYITTAIIDIAQMPYNALMNASISYGSFVDVIDINSMISVVYDACYASSVLVYIILLLLIGIAFIKLLLEAVERYVILFVLVYTTPLAASSLASESTSGIFKKFFTMFLSQCFLLILNVWSLQMITSLFANMGNSTNPMITLLVGYAFLRIASRLDSYLNSLGLNAAVTGAGLGSEIMAAGMSMLASGSSFKGGKAAAGGGGVLGFSKDVANTIGKINPVSGLSTAAQNFVGGVGKTVAQSAEAAMDAASGVSGTDKISTGANAFGSTFKTKFGENSHAQFMKTQDQSLWMRGVGQAAAGGPDNPTVSETAEKIFNNGTLSNQELRDVSNTPFAANNVFNGIPEDGEVNDSTAVAATMQGIGLTNAFPEAEEAIQAGLGNIDADHTSYKLTSDGAQMAYSVNGRGHTWDIKNAAQMDALSAQEQAGYTQFKNGHHTFYAKHTAQNDRVGAAFEKASTSDTPITLSENTRQDFNDAVTSHQWSGVPKSTQQKITDAIYSGDESVVGSITPRRICVEDRSSGYGISIFTDKAIGTGEGFYTADDLKNRGYSYNNINGNTYWVKASNAVPADHNFNKSLFDEA